MRASVVMSSLAARVTTTALAFAVVSSSAPQLAQAAPTSASDEAMPSDEPARRAPTPGTLMISGGTVGLSGLLISVAGASTFAGIHVGNPGPGLQLVGGKDDDSADARRLVQTARAMGGLAIAGGVVAAAGLAIFAVGVHRYRKEARQRRARLAVAPGLASVWLVGRF